jgi:hypothetical protein
LKAIVADQALACQALKEVAKGRMKVKFTPSCWRVGALALLVVPVGDGAFVGDLRVFGGGALGLAALLAVERLPGPAGLARGGAGLEFDAAELLGVSGRLSGSRSA